jgi:hypothetical protein
MSTACVTRYGGYGEAESLAPEILRSDFTGGIGQQPGSPRLCPGYATRVADNPGLTQVMFLQTLVMHNSCMIYRTQVGCSPQLGRPFL